MKILHIIYSLSSGGAERFLVDLANELSQREDCDVRLLILKTDQDERNVFYKNELCIRVHLESLGIRKMSLSLFFKLYHFIKKENPDIVFNKNIKEVTDATLINAQNADQAIDRIYRYYMRAESVTGDVLLKDKVVGQRVEIDTGYDGKKSGVIESVDYSFGNAIKAKVTIHE